MKSPGRIRHRFKRDRTSIHILKFVLGLIAGPKGKSIESIAFQAELRYALCRSIWPFHGWRWLKMTIRNATRGECILQVKADQAFTVGHQSGKARCPVPTHRTGWPTAAGNPQTCKPGYSISNGPAPESPKQHMADKAEISAFMQPGSPAGRALSTAK